MILFLLIYATFWVAEDNAHETISGAMEPQSYIFGYGSLINDYSRLVTSGIEDHSDSNAVPHYFGGGLPGDLGVAVSVSPDWGYERAWSFQSSTGFTALGLRQNTPPQPQRGRKNIRSINGVIFPVDDISSFDKRETGYVRVKLPLNFITILDTLGHDRAKERAIQLKETLAATAASLTTPPSIIVWAYIPGKERLCVPTEHHPILQVMNTV